MFYNASNIKVLKGLEAVRVRPAMYIGSTNQKGLNHLVYEIVDNSVDEASNGYGTEIYVCLNEDGSCTVSDKGRGIPVDLHESGVCALRVVLTTLHAGGKFDNKGYATSGGLHGVGSSVVNALSISFNVEVHRGGYVYIDSYARGVPVTQLNQDGTLPSVGSCNDTGTTITFTPDGQIFSATEFKAADIQSRLHEIAYLNPFLTLTFEDKRKGRECRFTYHEPNGLSKYVRDLNKGLDVVNDAFSFHGSYCTDKGEIQADVCLQYIQHTQERIFSFCNNICTEEGGAHVTAFKSCLTSLINKYSRELGYLKEKDDNFTGSDVRCGLTAVVSVKHPDPQFEGQTKTKLQNQDASTAVTSICMEQLQLYFDKHEDVLKNIIEIAQKCSKLRKSQSSAKDSLFSVKKKYSFDSNGKLASCLSKDYFNNELFIVEGDSAAGSGKMARDRKHQAILPIRGKILNVEKAPMDKVLANEEIKTIIYALGCGFGEGYGNDFDISKLKYDKIIIMTDSDVDGSHITSLLMTLFYKLLPELVYKGHLYIAVSPLYKAFPTKGNPVYLYTDNELNEYKCNHKVSHVQRFKGLGELNPEQLWDTTMNPKTRLLKQVTVSSQIAASKAVKDLMGVDVQPRKKFIYDCALEANVDI